MRKAKIIILSLLTILLIAGICFFKMYKITEIEVYGCQIVEAEDVRFAVENSGYMNNSIILYIKNKFNPIKDIPLVAKLDIEIVGRNKVVVTVYEKQSAGCIEYMNRYVYFDKDGIVLEALDRKIENVPCIEGLSFNSWIMGEKLPIDDETKFKNILTITQLVEKYELDITGIEFTAENEIVLMYENIKIEMGDGNYLPVQMMNLRSILESLEGESGTLYMKDFNSEDATASFKKN